MTLRCLIVDDEPIARRVLREELETMNGVEVAGEAENGSQALELISRLRPDLVLLDLQMPGMTGFDVVRALPPNGRPPSIVIVTAYDRHAIEAFQEGAIDYLLKPVSRERLAVAVDRARQRGGPAPAAEPPPPPPGRLKVVARAGPEYVLLNADEVYAFQADGDLVWVLTSHRKYLATQTLRTLEERLAAANFRRVHRGALVNMDHVRKMSALSSQRWLLTLSNNLEFIVSKRLAHGVRQSMRW